ncbi:MAG TPA: UDP-N-acetylmuramoyl-L-alanyl-D-glutamate--2,6-diaminopimelate ligase [Bryobacteraceae bacterium]|nr:UDP-N-acetylmuramoyl-L-alanyl-D-glutamate--2,6-diaminopimelate ligase [Bryobacteraceae bacterium]
MQLPDVLSGVPPRAALPCGLLGSEVRGLAYNSQQVGRDFLFFAFPGSRTDGRQYASQALQRGAIAVISELPAPHGFSGPWIEVEHGRRALALACRNFFGPPERDLFLTGITGTNGKTTITYLIDAVLRRAGKRTGVFGTIGNQLAGERVASANTTPESLDLYRLFAELRARGGTHVIMEVSSHGLALGRVYALPFHTVVFTNLSQDHLDFHPSMESYFEAKHLLFVANGAATPKFAVINVDDEYGRRIQPGPEAEVLRYGLHPGSCVRAENINTGFDGVSFTLHYKQQQTVVRSPLVGTINVYNILAACAAGISYELDLEMIAAGIADCTAVPGRFERVDEGQPFLVVVDYAHTPDALRNAIAVARTLKPKRVITVFGCGGDRDRGKRPLMGMAAGELSDYVVLTSDNPRSEEPLNIINDALVGLRRLDTPHQVEPDRTRAIRLAVEEAGPGDLILLAGKGHETYQVLQDKTVDFDDRETARQVLKEFGYRRKTG